MRFESRSWQQSQRAGSKADRMVRTIEVTIPPHIANLTWDLPSSMAETLNSVTRKVSEIDHMHGVTLDGLGGLLLRTESVASSKIEQISASAEDFGRALHGSKANPSATSMVAAAEAMNHLLIQVEQQGCLDQGMLLSAHGILMADNPLNQDAAGCFREVQNWVGGSDHSPLGALLIPPPPELLAGLLQDLSAFLRRTDIPSLVQATVAHAQFETIHPFVDGNGRIGRALVNAVLRLRGESSRVVLPIASSLLARRERYFAGLDAYRNGNAEPILSQFIMGALISAEESRATAIRIGEIHSEWLAALGRTRSGSAPLRLLEHFLSMPILSASQVELTIGGSTSAAYAAIDRLMAVGIVQPLTDRKRNQVWGATALLDELDALDNRIQVRARATEQSPQ